MTQPTDRPGVDDLTSDMLDQLYADLDWAREQTLAAQQEATAAATRLERTEAERDMLGRETDRLRKDWLEMRTRAEKAEAERDAVQGDRDGWRDRALGYRLATERVRALHQPWDADPASCAHCVDGYGTPVRYPCPTVTALDQNGQTTQETT